MPERAIDTTEITLGEVYRLIEKQSGDLSEIKADVKQQNGSVAALATRVAVLEDRGIQGRDNHARYAGWIGTLAAAGSWIYQLWTHRP